MDPLIRTIGAPDGLVNMGNLLPSPSLKGLRWRIIQRGSADSGGLVRSRSRLLQAGTYLSQLVSYTELIGANAWRMY